MAFRFDDPTGFPAYAIVQKPPRNNAIDAINEARRLLKPGHDRLLKEMEHKLPFGEEASTRVIELAKKFDKETCEKWTEEIDTLLVFAGLFSAVVTAFAVASFVWLQLNEPDTTTQLLLQISYQIQTISPGVTMNISAIPPADFDSPIDHTIARRVNALWFSSLSLSVIAALISILCKQWVRAYALTSNLDALKAFSIRQMRYEGLITYGVPATISSISIFLEISVVLFFIGLVSFTWSFDRLVAFPVLILASLTGLFLLATTITPSIQYIYVALRRSFEPLPTQCAWKSPQSWLVLRFWNLVVHTIDVFNRSSAFQRKSDTIEREEYLQPPLATALSSWSSFDAAWTSQHDQCDATVLAGPGALPYISSGLPWVLKTVESPLTPYLAYHLLYESILGHDKPSAHIFNMAYLSVPSQEAARRAIDAVAQEKHVGNAPLIAAVMDAKDDDFLLQNALEDEQRVRLNRTVPTCIMEAFDEWATCSIHSSSCSGEFTLATLLYLTGVCGEVGLEHCARLIGAHLGHEAKGKHFPFSSDKTKGAYKIPSAVHVVFAAHMTTVLERASWTYGTPLDRMLLEGIVEPLLAHEVLHVNAHDEYKIPGRDFLLAGNIPRLQPNTLAYFPEIIRYYVLQLVNLRPPSGRFIDMRYLPLTLRALDSYVSLHALTSAGVVRAFQNMIINELFDLMEGMVIGRLGMNHEVMATAGALIKHVSDSNPATNPHPKWSDVIALMQSYADDWLVIEQDIPWPRPVVLLSNRHQSSTDRFQYNLNEGIFYEDGIAGPFVEDNTALMMSPSPDNDEDLYLNRLHQHDRKEDTEGEGEEEAESKEGDWTDTDAYFEAEEEGDQNQTEEGGERGYYSSDDADDRPAKLSDSTSKV